MSCAANKCCHHCYILRTRRSDRIPLRMGILNLAHEILHSFGVDHDNSSCAQVRFEALQSVYKNQPCDVIKIRDERRSGKENP